MGISPMSGKAPSTSNPAYRSMVFHVCMLSAVAVLYVVFILRTRFTVGHDTYFTLVDDAMISMRYARNLASGYGAIWNVGEKPVQGYTNLGWMLYMAVLHRLQLPASMVSLPVMFSNLLVLILNIWTVKRLAARVSQNGWLVPTLSSTLVAFYFPLVYWSLRGMEVGVVCLLINTATVLCLRLTERFEWKLTGALALILALSLLVRIDAALQVCILVAFLGVYSHRNGRCSEIVLVGLVLASALLLLYLCQKSYYGRFLPNTYYLKVTGVSVSERISVGIRTLLQVSLRNAALLVVVAFAGLLLYSDVRTPSTVLLLCLFAVQCAYSVYVGGDYAEYQAVGANRFVTQGMSPLLVVFSVVCCRFLVHFSSLKSTMTHRLNRGSLALLLFLSSTTILILCGVPWRMWVTKNAHLLSSDIWRARLGVLVGQGTYDEARVAAHAVGQISYYSQRHIIDLLGKNDEFVAMGIPSAPFRPGHNKWNYDYSILRLEPDVVADEWGDVRAFMETHTDVYERLPNGVWIRKDSGLVNVSVLSMDYRYTD